MHAVNGVFQVDESAANSSGDRHVDVRCFTDRSQLVVYQKLYASCLLPGILPKQHRAKKNASCLLHIGAPFHVEWFWHVTCDRCMLIVPFVGRRPPVFNCSRS